MITTLVCTIAFSSTLSDSLPAFRDETKGYDLTSKDVFSDIGNKTAKWKAGATLGGAEQTMQLVGTDPDGTVYHYYVPAACARFIVIDPLNKRASETSICSKLPRKSEWGSFTVFKCK